MLFYLSDHVRGFDYDWKPFTEAAVFGEKEWHPVHVNHHKGDISPGVLTIDGKQILGKVIPTTPANQLLSKPTNQLQPV